jgi:hypothetical protein
MSLSQGIFGILQTFFLDSYVVFQLLLLFLKAFDSLFIERSTDPPLVAFGFLETDICKDNRLPSSFLLFRQKFNLLFYETVEVINKIICCTKFEMELKENIVGWFDEINQWCSNITYLMLWLLQLPCYDLVSIFFAKLWSKILEG